MLVKTVMSQVSKTTSVFEIIVKAKIKVNPKLGFASKLSTHLERNKTLALPLEKRTAVVASAKSAFLGNRIPEDHARIIFAFLVTLTGSKKSFEEVFEIEV